MITALKIPRIAWLVFSALAIFYIYTVSQHSINVPFSDDFHQQLHTAINLENGSDALTAIFRQHNVHRLFTTHVFTYLEHTFTGKVDLSNQLLIAFIFLVALAIVISSYGQTKHRSLLMLVVALIVFSPIHSAAWVGGTTQYYALLLFGLLALKWLDRIDHPLYLIASVLCMLLAVYSMIGGLIVPVLGSLYLLICRRAKLFPSLVWLSVSLAIGYWYLSGFSSHSNQPSIFYFVQEPGFVIEFTLRLLGNFLGTLINREVLVYLTALVILVFLYLVIVRRPIKRFIFELDGLAFIYVLLLAGTVVAGRAGFEDQNIAYADRYFIYTKTLWLLGFIVLSNRQQLSKHAAVAVLLLSMAYSFSMYRSELPNLKARQLGASNSMLDFIVRGNPVGFNFNNRQQHAGRLVQQARELGIYTPGLLPTPSRELKYLKYTDFKDGLVLDVTRDVVIDDYRYLAFTVANQSNVHEVSLVPRGVYGPAYLLKAAALIDPTRLTASENRLSPVSTHQYEVIIDKSAYDSSQQYDIFVISLGMIGTLGTL